MAGGAGIDFGAGIARGLADVFSANRASTIEREREREGRDQDNARYMIDHLIRSGRVEDYADLQPYFDIAFGLSRGPKGKGRQTHALLSSVLAPTFPSAGRGAAQPGGSAPEAGATPAAPAGGSIMDASGTITGMGDGAAVPEPGPVSAPAAAPGARPLTTTVGGVRLRTDEGMADAAAALEQRKFDVLVKRARAAYDTFRAEDKDFTLRDAMRAVGLDVDIYRGGRGGTTSLSQAGSFGAFLVRKAAEKEAAGDPEPLTSDEILEARTEFYAANRSMGVNRESLARAEFGQAFAMLTSEQQQAIIKKETQLIGGQSYARAAATNKADFDAPLTPTQAQTTNLPVGTTGGQVAGQQVLTQPEIKAREDLQSTIGTLRDIRDRLVPAALPPNNEFVGSALAGPQYMIRRRLTHPEQIAALESAVSNTVNTLARARGQLGAQSEGDIKRAENAVTQMREALSSGDTVETAQARIDESLKILEDVFTRLPQQAVPQAPTAPARATPPAAPPARGGAPQALDVNDPGRRTRARAKLIALGAVTVDDATITKFLTNNPTFR